MAETKEDIIEKIRQIKAEQGFLNSQLTDLRFKLFEMCPVSLHEKVSINNGERTAFISYISASDNGRYHLGFVKAKKDGTPSMLRDYIYSMRNESIIRVSDGFNVSEIMA